jgi:hypothetical protein
LLEDVATRLNELLERARSLKPSGSIEPPLPVAGFIGEHGLPIQGATVKLHQLAVEVAVKQALQTQLVRAESKTLTVC